MARKKSGKQRKRDGVVEYLGGAAVGSKDAHALLQHHRSFTCTGGDHKFSNACGVLSFHQWKLMV